MNIKKWIINPCNKCLVFACCNQACVKLKDFMQKQSIIWISIGFILTTFILTSITYTTYIYHSVHPLILIGVIIAWLGSGVYFYREILDTSDNNNTFAIIFSFVWLPYVVFSVFIGMMVALFFTKKKNANFLTGDIWNKKEIK